MSGISPSTREVAEAVAAAYRIEWGRVLSATVRVTRDLDLAEECVQDAYAKALQTWGSSGIPTRPGGWLTTVARNRALDLRRRESLFRRALPELVVEDLEPGPGDDGGGLGRDDDRLRLIFTCCHPSLGAEAQVALTLRLLCGLSTAEVARAFLVREPTMAARITRAKRKIAAARIPYRVPAAEDLPERLAAVLEVVHLVFTTGHSAPVGQQLMRRDLVERAFDLARMLHGLFPADPGVVGLLALMLLTDARRETRLSADGRLALLSEQDRSRWDAAQIDEGVRLLDTVVRDHLPARYALQAAIAAEHARAASWEVTDWARIEVLYDVLADVWPSPVVELNRAVAIGLGRGPEAGLVALDRLLEEPVLAAYAYLSAARADFLRRLERWDEAAMAYDEAFALTGNDVERTFLAQRLAEVEAHRG